MSDRATAVALVLAIVALAVLRIVFVAQRSVLA